MNHDDYIAAAPDRFRGVLNDLRGTVNSAFPDATEVFAYGMPGFRIGERTEIGYAAFTRQCGLYLPKAAIAECAAALKEARVKHTTTGVTFTDANPMPDAVLGLLLAAAGRALQD